MIICFHSVSMLGKNSAPCPTVFTLAALENKNPKPNQHINRQTNPKSRDHPRCLREMFRN